ncbi:MAG TPA: hypothetical protein VF177_05520 [Anaerolineae bacterium]
MNKALLLISLLFLFVLVGCRAPEPEDAGDDVVTSIAATPEVASPEATTEARPETTATEEPTATAEATAPAAETPTAEATAPPGAVSDRFCPDVTRPALILFIPGEEYVVTNPLTGETCSLPFPEPLPGRLQAAGDALYYQADADGTIVVHRLAPDGAVETLSYTAIDPSERGLALEFVASDEGDTIAWSSAGPDPDDQENVVSDLWLADIASGEVSLLASHVAEGESRALIPVRFSETGETLVYTLQPIGLGGIWSAFVGRYDNLYTIPVTGGEPTLVYDCAADGLFLCIGDFDIFRDEAPTLAIVDAEAGTVLVRSSGQVINTLPIDAEYVAFPTFSQAGELIFYSADLSEEDVLPQAASLHRVAPPTAPAETVISDPRILLPQRFLDDSHVVVGFAGENDSWGLALVNIHQGTLQPLSEWPNASLVGVLPAPPPPAQPLQVFGETVQFLVDPSLAYDVRYEVVPAVTEEQAGGFTYSVLPEHKMFTFVDPYVDPASLYRQTVNTYPEPRLFVFPVAELVAMNELAAEQIAQLQSLLEEQPAEVEGALPFLPPPNGQQVFHAQVEYVTFEGGKGVRYLTTYNQEPRQVNNTELFYTFQGITDDGATYIAAQFPVAAPNLPAESDIADMDAFMATYEQHLTETVAALNELDPGEFTPDLTLLDNVIRSIQVTAP